jgi:hypothetical protein
MGREQQRGRGPDRPPRLHFEQQRQRRPRRPAPGLARSSLGRRPAHRRAPGGTLVRSHSGVRRPGAAGGLRPLEICHRRDPHIGSPSLLERPVRRSIPRAHRLPGCPIEAEAQARRESQGKEPLGREAILAQEPHSKPVRSKKSPAPRFHAFRKSVRRELYEAYAWFVGAFREASEKLRSGDRTARFPPGSFPPALPFVA